MAEPISDKKTRPARRRQAAGWLDRDAGGRTEAELREEIRRTVEEATGLMRRILDGTFEEPLRDRNGTVVGSRPATIRELTAAYRCLLDRSLTNRPEEKAPESKYEALKRAQAAAIAEAAALDGLDAAELAALRRWAENLGGSADA